MIHLKNNQFEGAEGRKSLFDLHIPENWNGKLIVFLHGFMGYKDWGAWNLVSQYFTQEGYAFAKYNVSHNGCTINEPTVFADLDAFAENTYSKELEDLDRFLNVLATRFEGWPETTLIGHSRGGGIALLMSHDERIDKVISWAAIASIGNRFPKNDALDQWKKDGVRTIRNGRTQQDMPMNFVQFEDFSQNRKRLNIEFFCRTSNKPTLVIHGADDSSVKPAEGERIAEWLQTELVLIPETGHTFDSKEPWTENELPAKLKEVCQKSLEFVNEPINHALLSKQSMIADLIKMAKSDDEFKDAEFHFLHTLAKQLGLSTDDFTLLFERYIAFNPPKLEVDRIVQFQRLVLLMSVDLEIDESELNYIRTIGIRMGLHPGATEEVLRVMHEYENNVVPPDRLINIFKTFHN